MTDVYTTEFPAASERRYTFARVEDTSRIPRRLKREELSQIVLRELHTHLIELLDPHAVFARYRTTNTYAQLKYPATHLFRGFQITRIVGIKQNKWMQVTVSCMKYVCHSQSVFARELGYLSQHARKFSSWDSTVHAVVVR